jgi:hypothetical protein
MRLVAKDKFVGAAERAYAALDLLHQPECDAALTLPRAPTYEAIHANIG